MSEGISIIIPVYNREKLLGATLESLLAQTLSAVEIIVVDDGSTDGTVQVATEFGPKVRVIRQENRGPAAARNNGFRASTGEFIHFFDSDDIAVATKQEVQLKYLQDHSADIAFGPWIKGVFSERRFSPENGVYQQNGLPDGDLVKSLLCNWSIVPHACLFRRSIIEKAGGFPEDLHVGEDQLMFLNCLLAGAKVVHTPESLELYRVENSDKITASPEGGIKRLVEWGRFLLKADATCLSTGVNPRNWFAFQCRAYAVCKELRCMDFPEKEALIAGLEKLFRKHFSIAYEVSGHGSQKLQGLQSRITGVRGNRSFKMGRLTDQQKGAILLSGYELQ
jgi:glycosyltransferase involved in cell wall biosynthesis